MDQHHLEARPVQAVLLDHLVRHPLLGQWDQEVLKPLLVQADRSLHELLPLQRFQVFHCHLFDLQVLADLENLQPRFLLLLH